MGRYSPSKSSNHHVRRFSWDHYRLSWTVDRYFAGSRLRHPTVYTRDTDEAGARRFAKKHGLPDPVPAEAT
jgi:hypothetical protein